MRSIRKIVEIAEAGLIGKDWYRDATYQIDLVCKLADWSPETLAGVLATTSPRCSVRRNIRISLHYMQYHTLPGGIMRTVHTALNRFIATGVISGQKTSSFRDALLGDPSAVVLDVHMAYALQVPQTAFNRIGDRAEAKRRIRLAGKRLGLSPAESQACVWTGQRHNAGFNYVDFPILEEYLKHAV